MATPRRHRLGMTRTAIVEAAVALTAEYGLDGWSQRQLTTALDTSPSVLFHHVGDRHAVNAAVVEGVLRPITTPGAQVGWEAWFRATWTSIHPLLAGHRGVAHWMLMNGPVFDHMMPILDEAIGLLLEAGFGEEAPLAYATIFNTMTSMMAFTDERADPHTGAMRDHRQMAEAIAAQAGDSPGPGAEALLALLGRYTSPDADLAALNQAYFGYTLDRVIDGLRVRRDQITACS